MATLQFDLNPLKSHAFTLNAEKHLQTIKHNLMNGFHNSNETAKSNESTKLDNNKNRKNINKNYHPQNVSSKIVKNRSIYGQPKIHFTEKCTKSSKSSASSCQSWRSLDSLSAPSDSGSFPINRNSLSASTSTSISDIRSRFETNASDLGTSVETSEDEADTYKRHELQYNCSLETSQISNESEAFEPFLVYENKDNFPFITDEESFSILNDKDNVTGDKSLRLSFGNREDYEDFSRRFMKDFVERIFENSSAISREKKAMFGEFARSLTGRLWFARYINEQRNHNKLVSESTFYSLAQYFALILFECCEADDYTPARILMNMCFTYCLQNTSSTIPFTYPSLSPSDSFSSPKPSNLHNSVTHSSGNFLLNRRKLSFCSQLAKRISAAKPKMKRNIPPEREPKKDSPLYLVNILSDQAIWKSARFWNAAFFDAIQDEREIYFFRSNNNGADKNTANNFYTHSKSSDNRDNTDSTDSNSDESTDNRSDKHPSGDWNEKGAHEYCRQSSYDDWQFQANITFGALATFTHNMHSFGLPEEFCLQFLQKQATIANLTAEQVRLVRDNIQLLYHKQ